MRSVTCDLINEYTLGLSVFFLYRTFITYSESCYKSNVLWGSTLANLTRVPPFIVARV